MRAKSSVFFVLRVCTKMSVHLVVKLDSGRRKITNLAWFCGSYFTKKKSRSVQQIGRKLGGVQGPNTPLATPWVHL